MRVLYANHTGQVSGAERSLIDLVGGLPLDISAVVACPPGPLTDTMHRLGFPVAPIPATDGSLRFHPWYSARGVAALVRTAVCLRNQARRSAAQLVHANSIRAGLAAVLATKLGGPPAIVHVRDCLPPSITANAVRTFLMSGAAMLITNSRYTTARFTEGYRPHKVVIIHNPVDLTRFSPDRISRAEGRVRLGLEGDGPVLGVIGQLTPWKGHDDAMRCLSLLRPSWPTARLVVVGSAVFTSRATRYDNLGYLRALKSLALDLGLNGSLRFLGEREDVPEILRAVDILLVPSWEEPFGRTVVEAMAMAVPVIATDIGGPAEIITHGVDGMLLPPKHPARWARTIHELLGEPDRLAAIGRAGRRTAIDRFTVGAHVTRVLSVYRHVLGAQPN